MKSIGESDIFCPDWREFKAAINLTFFFEDWGMWGVSFHSFRCAVQKIVARKHVQLTKVFEHGQGRDIMTHLLLRGHGSLTSYVSLPSVHCNFYIILTTLPFCISFNFYYSDQVNPTITCPGTQISSTGQVTWNPITATDDLDTSVQTSCNPMSGSTFTQGLSMVTCTATDDAGNQDMCMFSVTVGMYFDETQYTLLFHLKSLQNLNKWISIRSGI